MYSLNLDEILVTGLFFQQLWNAKKKTLKTPKIKPNCPLPIGSNKSMLEFKYKE